MRAEVLEKRLKANGEKIIGLQPRQWWSEERVLSWPKGSLGFFQAKNPWVFPQDVSNILEERGYHSTQHFLLFCFFVFVFLSRVCYTKMLLFYVLVFWLRHMCSLSFPTRDQTCSPCIVSQSASRWTAREVPQHFSL